LTITLANLNRFFNDIDELRERLISVWCELDQTVVNHAIDEWRRRLSACVDVDLGVTWVCVHDLTWHQNDLKVD